MPAIPYDHLSQALWETLIMTGVSGAISFALGLPLGLVLVNTAPGGLWANGPLNRGLGAIVNGFRSLPFIILLVALIPVTRKIVGTSIGTAAAIVPLSVAAIPYYARVAESSARGRQGSRQGRAGDGGQPAHHHTRGAGARGAAEPRVRFHGDAGAAHRRVRVAGAVGAGGLGDLAIRYGYQRFDTAVMVAVIVVLIALVALIQANGDRLARRLDHR